MSDKFSIFLAHVRQDTNDQWLPHLLDDHLRGVAVLAEDFAAAFDAGDWAKLAGLWHDLGKYRSAFQHYIRGASGYDAHIETAPGRVDHSTAGALHAMARMKGLGRILAYLIAGHHAGLPDWQSAEAPASSLANRLQQPDLLAEALAQSPARRFSRRTVTELQSRSARLCALDSAVVFLLGGRRLSRHQTVYDAG